MFRDTEYWQEKVIMTIDEDFPKLKRLMKKEERKEYAEILGRMAEKDYRNQLSMVQMNPQTEMTAREFTEDMINRVLKLKLDELQPKKEEEKYQEPTIDWNLFR